MNKALRIDALDNVAVALIALTAKEIVLGTCLLTNIAPGHKFALVDIGEHQNIVKYGRPIGHATQAIKAGEHIHTHNVKTNLGANENYAYEGPVEPPAINGRPELTFNGYLRQDGRVGIRNELWIIPTVGCINRLAQTIAEKSKKTFDVTHIDAIQVFSHPYGCSQLGDDLKTTKETLQRLVNHPNAGGVLVIGLGCENNQVSEFKKTLGTYDSNRVRFLIAQEVADEIESALEIIGALIIQMKQDGRSRQPISKLQIGLKCGGSDGLSGITANPLVGRLSDFVVASGGSSVLTEVPEMFGAERVLMERANCRATFERTVDLINQFKDYYRQHDQPIYENPSPGNKEGGITTLEDKSLGCTQKSGHSIVTGVLFPNEIVKEPGLHLLQGPGNDLISTTLLGTSGCQLILFTSGRGTPFGSFVPTIKISSNTDLAQRKPDWIDFNAGTLTEEDTYDGATERLADLVIAVASGQATKNEINDYREMAIFKNGVTL